MEVSSQSSKSTVDNKLKCSVCGKKYAKNCNLKRHFESVHSETHRFQCRNCEVYFSENATLQKHLNRQICVIKKDKKLMDITYDCKVCKKKFGAQHVLNLHIKQNHPENYYKYNCSQCDLMFSSKQGLYGHVDTIHNNNKAKCLICGLECYDKYKLNRHIENVHSPNAMKKRDDKLAARSEAELNREVYRKLKSDPGHILVKSTVDPSEHYYLKLNKKQRERVNNQKMLKPIVKEPVIGQHHIKGWGYTSEGNECPINYVKLTDEQRRSSRQVYGYVWRDGKTFEILEVYYGMTCDTAINGAIAKWTTIKASTDKGCSDRRMYDAGHFFVLKRRF
ncbi:transcriptional repressor CTCFL-like [Folsomia candida]|uniref:transcriptional repressor CTCFL-like n=1 Tax=Folsomia candida TaxID=158441 RepID=UPI00160555CC|nr:transcriptional repressor CTCFL-like [Folsomia candida]